MQKSKPYKIIKYLSLYDGGDIEWIIYHLIGLTIKIPIRVNQKQSDYG